MNAQQQNRSQVVSTGTMLRIIIPARVEILAVLFLGLLLGFLLAFEYAWIAKFTTKTPPIDRADTWLNAAAAAFFTCFIFPISREFLLALGGRREIITLTPSRLRIRFSTLGVSQKKVFAPNEVRALRLVPQEVDAPWPGGYIQFWHIEEEVSFARQISLSEAKDLIQILYRTGFLPNA